MNSITYEHLFQWAFAFSPFPSYLPQYCSIIQQLSTDNNHTNNNINGCQQNIATTSTSTSTVVDRGDSLRKRNYHHDPAPISTPLNYVREMMIPNPPRSIGLQLPTNSKSKSFDDDQIVTQNSNGSMDEDRGVNCSSVKPDTGLSRATVLLLLSAHLLRLLYFHGIVLEGSETLQYDLLGQSLAMICMQLLLLHAMMLVHRKHLSLSLSRRQKKRTSEIKGHSSTDSLLLSPTPPPPPMSGQMRINTSITLKQGNAPLTPRNGRQTKWRLLVHTIVVHLQYLFSPHNILHEHSFPQYIELLFISSMIVKLIFDYHWYPLYGMRIVNGLKHTSIVLESCLALPQTIRNYNKKSTDGLSVVMVGGWIAGDLFKLFYFLFNMLRGDNGNGNGVFVLGALLSITLDSIVGFQMIKTKPEAKMILRKIRQRVNKDDDMAHIHAK